MAKNIKYVPWIGYKYASINVHKMYNYINGYIVPKKGEACEDLETYKKIHYNNNDKNYCVYVAYNESKKFLMENIKVFLYKNNEKIDITQEPGVPYTLKASEMEGEYIEVIFCDTIYTYIDKPPMYCEELLD